MKTETAVERALRLERRKWRSLGRTAIKNGVGRNMSTPPPWLSEINGALRALEDLEQRLRRKHGLAQKSRPRSSR